MRTGAVNETRLWMTAWVLACIACGPNQPGVEPETAVDVTERLRVYVVNYPLLYFAERVGGRDVEVVFPAPSDEDPAYWQPTASTVSAFQNADLIVVNGAGYAKWVAQAALPSSRLVDSSSSFRDRYIINEGAIVHSHGPEGEHSHGDTAFTTWLDPELAIEQAKAIRDALTQLRPEAEARFDEGFRSLEADLEAWDEAIRELVPANPHLPLVASHPVYQYLARAYGLELQSVHFEPDEILGEAELGDLAVLLESHPATWMLWEDEPRSESVDALETMGVKSVVFRPCGNLPDEGDYLSVMQANLRALQEVFTASPP